MLTMDTIGSSEYKRKPLIFNAKIHYFKRKIHHYKQPEQFHHFVYQKFVPIGTRERSRDCGSFWCVVCITMMILLYNMMISPLENDDFSP